MKRIMICSFVFLLLLTSGGSAYGDEVITLTGAGQASAPSDYFPLQNAFDAQPTWDSQNEEPVGGTGGNDAPYYGNRFGYIDFGADWADVRITGTWTMYRTSSTGDQVGYQAMWWDDDIDTTNDGTAENTLEFNIAQGLNTGGSTPWIQDVDCSGSPVVPQARYLMLHSDASMTNRAKEYAIVGYIVSNTAPSVDAGSDALVDITVGATLDGTVTDDGEPNPPGTFTVEWTKQSGPGTVIFGDDEAVDTTAGFSVSGTYVLRLAADDSELTDYDDVTITVNAAPSVDAGSNDTITLPSAASLDGTVSDDGIPTSPGTTVTTWTKQSGPGTVTFGDDGAIDTTASFSVDGSYVLRLTADDGDLTAYDEVSITVNPEPGVEDIITPDAAGAAGDYFPLQYAFDSQPTWDSQNDEPVGTETGGTAPSNADRYGYIDLGEDWMFLRITQTWTRYRTYSGTSYHTHSGYADMWWDNDKDVINDSGLDENTLNFNSAQYLPHVNAELWVQDADCTASPVAPLGRYLLVHSPLTMSNRANEYAIVGYSVSPTKTILAPSAAGAAAGDTFPLQYAFDGQPAWDGQNEEPTGGGGTYDAPAYSNRYGYIDFGTDYRKVRITAAWTKYMANSSGNHSGYAELWWDDDLDDWNDGIPENTLNFNSGTSVPDVGQELWVEDVAVADNDPIIPAARYLIVKSPASMTSRAVEYALVGWISDVSFPEPDSGDSAPLLTLDEPQVFDYGQLTLVDEVICGDPQETHTLYESPSGASSIDMILSEMCRVLPDDLNEPSYFGYVLGEDCDLEAGKAYVLVVEYPEDRPRSMVVVNHGCETNRGFHTGKTAGDSLDPPYVASNAEAMNYGFTGDYREWQQLFHLHDRFPEIQKPRTDESTRPYFPDDGFYVLICQYEADQAPVSAGAAVKRIALYEAPTLANYTQTLATLPEGLPSRHLFWREEMSDGVITSGDPTKRGVIEDIDWYEYKARLYKFLGMNTYTKDLLEFGHNQGWDCAKYGGAHSDWYNVSAYTWRWEEILTMLAKENYGLNVMPYYEYAGGDGQGDAALGKKKRCIPLERTDGTYTHITWSENLNIDVSDPDAVTDATRLLQETITELYQGNRPEPTDATGTNNSHWKTEDWGYIDFGADYDDVRICQTWTRSRKFNGGDASPFTDAYWHTTTAGFSGSTVPQGAIEETTLNFLTQTQLPGSNRWTKDVETTSSPITPQARYLVMRSPDPMTDCTEFLIAGYIDGQGTDLETISVTAGSVDGYPMNYMFDAQPDFNSYGGVNVIGAWFRARPSAIPMGFAEDSTLVRFSNDLSISPTVTRANLIANSSLLEDYYDWWFDQRKEYFNDLRDYLQTNVDSDAIFLYTWDHTESGPTHPSDAPDIVCDDLSLWGDLVGDAMTYDDAVAEELHYEALTLPAYNWSAWEWPHSVPRGDGPNYQSNDDVMMAYIFNKLYTVADSDWFDEYRSNTGLAITRHYCLNEDCMEDSSSTDIVGYFVADMEVAGPYCMLPEARAVAYGDPYYIGYLSSNSFNRGFPGYVREFNANFLALPALPLTTETGATTESDVVVRSISTQNDGTWLAIINVGFEDLEDVEITLPVNGTTTDAVTGSSITVTSGKTTLDLWPGQLKSIHIDN